MEYVNWLSIIIATSAAFILGYLWYSDMFFGDSWKVEQNISNENLNSGNTIQKYGAAFLMTFVYAYMLAKIMIRTDFSGIADGLKLGLMIGVCFCAMNLGINYLFSQKSMRLYFIDAGYIVASSTLMGTVIGSLS